MLNKKSRRVWNPRTLYLDKGSVEEVKNWSAVLINLLNHCSINESHGSSFHGVVSESLFGIFDRVEEKLKSMIYTHI